MARGMKDSGIECTEKNPKHWNRVPLKYVSTYNDELLKENTQADFEFLYLDIGSVSYENGIETYQELCFNTAPSRARRVVREKDVILSTVRTYLKACAQIPDSDKPIIVSTGFISLRANIKFITSEFLKYSVLNHSFVSEIEANSYGVNYPAINAPDVVRLKLLVPPISIQNKISNYLDCKCSEIDSLVDNITKEIELLKEYRKSVIYEAVTKGLAPNVEMKDSGIEWVGKMPIHWESNRGKFIFSYLQKPVKDEDGVITCFRDGEVTLRSKRREEGFTFSDKEIGYQGIDIGDLIVHGMDGFAGAIGISDSRGKASPVLIVLDTVYDKKYYMYYLRIMAYTDVFTATATGIRVRSCDLRWNKLAEFSYPVPPVGEQHQIAYYIDSKCSEIDSIIASKQEQIDTLKEYKKSLIYEYVTGKKEVPAV